MADDTQGLGAPLDFDPFAPVFRPLLDGEARSNPDGSTSTEITTSIEVDGRQMVFPTLWMGPSGPVELPAEEAIQRAFEYEKSTGLLFPRFDTIHDANAFSERRSNTGGISSGPLASAPEASDIGLGAPLDFDPFGDDAPGRASAYAREFARGAGEIAAGVPQGAAIMSRDVAEGLAAGAEDAPARNIERQQNRIAALEEGRATAQAAGDAAMVARIDEQIAQAREWIATSQMAGAEAEPYEPGPVTETAAFKAGEAIRGALPQSIPQYQDELGAQVSQGFGSAAAFLLGGAATGGAGAAFLGSTSAAAGLYNEAKQSGASEEDARLAARMAGLIGTTEAIPVISWLQRRGGAGWKAFVKKVAFDAGEEAVQEGFQGTMQNLIAAGIYDPDRKTFENVPESMLVGAIVGGGIGAPMALRESREGQQERALREAAARGEAAPVGGADAAVPTPGAASAPEVSPPGVSARFGTPPSPEVDARAHEDADDAAILLAAGYTVDDFVGMSPAERAESVEEAKAAGVKPMIRAEAWGAIREAYAAAERSGLEPDDLSSPIPNDVIANGRATMEAAIEGRPLALPAPAINVPAEPGQVALDPQDRAPAAAARDPRRARDANIFTDDLTSPSRAPEPEVVSPPALPYRGTPEERAAQRRAAGRQDAADAEVLAPDGRPSLAAPTQGGTVIPPAEPGQVAQPAPARRDDMEGMPPTARQPAAATPMPETAPQSVAPATTEGQNQAGGMGAPGPVSQASPPDAASAPRPDSQPAGGREGFMTASEIMDAEDAAANSNQDSSPFTPQQFNPRDDRDRQIIEETRAELENKIGFTRVNPNEADGNGKPRGPGWVRATLLDGEAPYGMQPVRRSPKEASEVLINAVGMRRANEEKAAAKAREQEKVAARFDPWWNSLSRSEKERIVVKAGLPSGQATASGSAVLFPENIAKIEAVREAERNGGKAATPTEPTSDEASDWWKGLAPEDRAARLAAAGYEGKKANPAWRLIKKGVRERILSGAEGTTTSQGEGSQDVPETQMARNEVERAARDTDLDLSGEEIEMIAEAVVKGETVEQAIEKFVGGRSAEGREQDGPSGTPGGRGSTAARAPRGPESVGGGEGGRRAASAERAEPDEAASEQGVATKDRAAPLYVDRPVTNAADIIAWAKSQGFPSTLAPEDMHITVAFSREPVDGSAVDRDARDRRVVPAKGGLKPKRLGDEGAVVLPLSGAGVKPLEGRWQAYRDAGASWDFKGYIPHITITYQPGDVDLSKVEPYRGPIMLGAERQKPLDLGAGEGVPEAPTGAAVSAAPKTQAAAKGAKPSAPSSASKPDRIEDFGEKIEGARKDYADRLRDASDIDVASAPLAKSWPEPDYQKLIDGGADPRVVAFAHAARDEVPPRPRQSWKLARWVEKTNALRYATMRLLSGDASISEIEARFTDPAGRRLDSGFLGRVDLYEAVGHGKSLKGVAMRRVNYSKRDPSGAWSKFDGWAIERAAKQTAFSNWPRTLVEATTKSEAIAAFKRRFAEIETQPAASKQVRFDIYSRGRGEARTYFIGKKVGREVLELARFDTVDEARQYRQDNEADLLKRLEAAKSIPDERKESNSPRVGVDHRGGADVTPEQFSEAFGFRGVQFGNYVEGPRRQQDLNQAYDALMDLAGVLNVPSRALSLNGEMGLAFGARGKGNAGKIVAAAHYEPGQIVINLTKNRGAGSLAHEWWHGLDNYFSRSGGQRLGWMTERGRGSAKLDGVRPEVEAAFSAVNAAIKATGVPARAAALDRRRSKPYWTEDKETSARAFETYVIAKLQDQNGSNDYLANVVSKDAWDAVEAMNALVLGRDEVEQTYPYPTGDEMGSIREAFDNFFATVEHEDTPAGGVRLYRRARFAQAPVITPAMSRDLSRRLADLGLSDRVRLMIEQSFSTDALRMSQNAGEPEGVFGMNADGSDPFILVGASLDPTMTLDHEAVHALYNLGLFTPKEWGALSRRAKALWIKQHRVKERYPEGDEALWIEEAIAEEFATWADGRRRNPAPETKTAFERIRGLLDALGNWLRGNGFQTAEDVFGRVESGDVGRRIVERGGGSGPFVSRDKRGEREGGIVAYHGSPHSFERFSIEAIGTGEGAQVYGRGLYFAENEKIARWYRDKLAKAKIRTPSGDGIRDFDAGAVQEMIEDAIFGAEGGGASIIEMAGGEDAIADVSGQMAERLLGGDLAPLTNFQAAVLNAMASAGWSLPEPGHMYEVRINASPEAFLDWDAALSDQPGGRDIVQQMDPDLREALEDELDYSGRASDIEELTGREFYALLRKFASESELPGTTAESPEAAIAEWMLAADVAGIRYLDASSRRQGDGSRNYVVFDDESIDVVRRYRRSPARPAPFQTYEAKTRHELMSMFRPGNWTQLRRASSWGDLRTWATRSVVDRMTDLKRQQEAIERDTGGEIPLAQDAYTAETLFHGRAAERLSSFFDKDVKGILDDMHKAGVSQQEVDDYLRARHVRERNAQIAKLYENTDPDHEFVEATRNDRVAGGSGHSNAWADQTLAKAQRGKHAALLRSIGERVDAITTADLQARVAAGLYSQEQADAMRAAYKHYVPLRGHEGEEEIGGAGRGQGMQAGGPEGRRATGRTSESDSPLAYVFAQRSQGIIRAEKNRVAKTFLRLVEANPNPDFWQINRAERQTDVRKAWVQTGVDPDTGFPIMERKDVAVDRAQGPNPQAPNVLTVKVGGQPVYITTAERGRYGAGASQAAGIIPALKMLGSDNGNTFTDVMGRMTRILSALNTSWNPEWFSINIIRDLQTAGIQISDEGKRGLGKRMIKNWPKAMGGAVRYFSQGKTDTEWAKVAEDFAMNGGRVNWIDFRDVEGFKGLIKGQVTGNKIERMFGAAGRGGKAALDVIDGITTAGENAIRIAAYKAAVDMGVPKAKAASIARELTVNFNRRGQDATWINALYMFFNAAVQGNRRLLLSFQKSKTTRAVTAGLVMTGFLEALLGSLDDDEYEKLDDWERERNIVIALAPLGLGEGGDFAKIPIPYGFNVAKVLGTQIGRVALTGLDESEAAAGFAMAALNSFNPLGGSDFMSMVMPTVLDPVSEVVRNQNAFGSQVMPNKFSGDETPDSELYFPTVSATSKWLASTANWLSGGNEFRAGAIDVSPETIDHIFGSYAGGLGRLTQRIGATGSAMLSGDPVEWTKVPLARQFYTQAYGEMPTYRAYKSVSDQIAALESEIKGFAGKGREGADAVRRARERDPAATRMMGMVKASDKLIRDLRKAERQVRASGMDDDAKNERIRALREKQHEIRMRALERWFAAQDASAD